MNRKLIRPFVLFIMIFVGSCNEPETVVTNIVHPDGSVSRKIEMRSINDKVEDRFQISDLQVPFDSTWTYRDSCEVDESGDTIWTRRAEKLFMTVDDINFTYQNDSGANRHVSRRTGFSRSFKWFNTEFRFAETIEREMSFGYPVQEFLNKEELFYFYAPESIQEAKKNGPDSLIYMALSDSVSRKVDIWTMRNMVSEWIGEFSKLAKQKEGGKRVEDKMKSREDDLFEMIKMNEDILDSLWSNGIILKEFLGEADYQKFRTEADSALENVTEQLWVDFKGYSVRIVMPGIVTGTNGFIDSSDLLQWPVRSEFFLTENYEMWAESRVPNRWAWYVSGLFLLFVITGLMIRFIKKG